MCDLLSQASQSSPRQEMVLWKGLHWNAVDRVFARFCRMLCDDRGESGEEPRCGRPGVYEALFYDSGAWYCAEHAHFYLEEDIRESLKNWRHIKEGVARLKRQSAPLPSIEVEGAPREAAE